MAKNSSSISTSIANTTLDDVVFLEDSPMESNDISYWEFVNQSDVDDSDDESLLSFEENGFVSWYSIGEISSPKSQIGNTQFGFEEKGCNFVVGCDEIDLSSLGFEPNCGKIQVKFESLDDHGCSNDVMGVNSIRFESNCGKSGGMNVNFESFGDQGCYDDELDVNSIGFESNYGKSHGMHVKIESFDDGDHDDEEEDHDHDDDGYGLDDELVPWNVSGRLERQRMRKLGKRVFAKMSHSKRNPYRFVKPGCVHGKHGLGIKAA